LNGTHQFLVYAYGVNLLDEGRVFEYGLLGRIFGPKREEVGGCRRLQEELCKLFHQTLLG